MKKIFFYIFRIKENAGKVFMRVLDWSSYLMGENHVGDFFEASHIESNEIHSRRLWRIPGLCHAIYPGIQEGFVIEKTNLSSLEVDMQYFITNRPAKDWNSQQVLGGILPHWDTETGVFGIKDNTFHEDRVRYKTVRGVMSHVSLLDIAWNCLSAPVFEPYWRSMPMSMRMRFWRDHPEYNPLE
jgi:hypothetical protein